MKRSIITTPATLAATVLAAVLAMAPAPAAADLVGAFAHGQAGFVKGPHFQDMGYGLSLGVELVGIQAFGDVLFFREGNTWADAGIGYKLGLPVPVVDIYVRPAVSYVHLEFTREQQAEENLKYQGNSGFDASLLAGLDYPLVSVLYLGVQVRGGYVYLLSEGDGSEYASGMAVLRLKI